MNAENAMKTAVAVVFTLAAFSLWGCGEDTGDPADHGTFGGMAGAMANCEFDVVTFSITGGQPQEVHINGLTVYELAGAGKVSSDTWEVVTRRGVRFSDILTEAGVIAADDAPVNCVARDGFDPLRTKLAGDTTKLPTLAFVRDYGYVYVGSPGDKDPLYPEMEGKSLIVDYDVDSDAEVPAYLGGQIASLGTFRWKMIEKVDDQTQGIIETDPVVQ